MQQHSKFWTFLDDPNFIKLWAFWQKGVNCFDKALTPFLRSLFCLLFDAKLLIKILTSFSVQNVAIVQHVQPGKKSCSKYGRPHQSRGKHSVPLYRTSLQFFRCYVFDWVRIPTLIIKVMYILFLVELGCIFNHLYFNVYSGFFNVF